MPMTQAQWLQALYDSMAVQNVTQRFSSGVDIGHVIADNGGAIPFPDSCARFNSFLGMRAALAGYGTTGEVGNDIYHFTDRVNAQAAWNWFGARTGHTATLSKIKVSKSFCLVLRESTRKWQVVYKGARVLGTRWQNRTNLGDWGIGQDVATDGRATYVAPASGINYEMWPYRSVPEDNNITDFFGAINRELLADMRCWVVGCEALVEGSDKANSRFIGTIGIDHYATGGPGGARYWASGIPKWVADNAGAEWQNLRTDGQPQWVLAIGCFPITRSKGRLPPWGNYDGTWIYSDPPTLGVSWDEILGNPPPNPDENFNQPVINPPIPPGGTVAATVTAAAQTAALNAAGSAPLYSKDPAYIDSLMAWRCSTRRLSDR